MDTTAPSALAQELVAAAPPASEQEQQLALSLYRLLAKGDPVPVPVPALASHARIARADVDHALARWPGIFIDEHEPWSASSARRSGRCPTA